MLTRGTPIQKIAVTIPLHYLTKQIYTRMDTFFDKPDEIYRFFSFIEVSNLFYNLECYKNDLPNLHGDI
jgi:hypothetical protein